MIEQAYSLSAQQIEEFVQSLRYDERSDATIEKYTRDIQKFMRHIEGRSTITQHDVLQWKHALIAKGYAIRSVNSMIAAVNSLLHFLGLDQLRIKQIKYQRQPFSKQEQELSRAEYMRLIEAAKKKKDRRLSLLIQTICSTGIRVSELPFVTMQAVQKGTMTVLLKGKSRVVFLPKALCLQLQIYAQEQGIRSGSIFVTSRNQPLSRNLIWRQMKRLCTMARVERAKVFPHNLRHLFARCFYAIDKDLAKLADLLGHSSIETTRIYIATSGTEHNRKINQLRLLE